MPPESLDDGRYQLRRPLGKGGTAAVYEAYDHILGIAVAIKVLAPLGALRPGLRRRLRSETVAMRRVHHRNVLRVFDIRSEGEVDYVVMDLAPGGSLQDRLDLEGALPIEEAVGYAQQILAALAAAHVQGVIHRDVKPHNVLLDGDGVAMLADFGIALLVQDDDSDDRRTKSGVAMGSFAYMPPEQRIDAHEVDGTADLYATGATLYALLTAGNPVDLFTAGPDSVRWAGIPASLVHVIRTATKQRPEERYPDAQTFGRALDEALAGVPEADRSSPIMYYPSDHGTTDIVSRPAWMRATREAVTYLYGTPMPADDHEPTVGSEVDGAEPGEGRESIRAATWPLEMATGVGPGAWATRIPTEDVPRPSGGVPSIKPLPTSKGALAKGAPVNGAGVTGAAGAPVVSPRLTKVVAPPPGVSRSRRVLVLALAVLLSLVALGVWGWDLRPDGSSADSPNEPVPEVTGSLRAGEAGISGVPTVSPSVVGAAVQSPAPGSPAAGPPSPDSAPVASASKGPESERARPAQRPSTAGSPILGVWKGAFGGGPFTLELGGAPDALRGTATVSGEGSRSIRHAVEGTLDEATGRLNLADLDASSDSGRYALVLAGDHVQVLTGSFTRNDGNRTLQLALRRP